MQRGARRQPPWKTVPGAPTTGRGGHPLHSQLLRALFRRWVNLRALCPHIPFLAVVRIYFSVTDFPAPPCRSACDTLDAHELHVTRRGEACHYSHFTGRESEREALGGSPRPTMTHEDQQPETLLPDPGPTLPSTTHYFCKGFSFNKGNGTGHVTFIHESLCVFSLAPWLSVRTEQAGASQSRQLVPGPR